MSLFAGNNRASRMTACLVGSDTALTAGDCAASLPPLRLPVLCRPACGACCIAPSISVSLPALPHGKPAGARCPHLDDDVRCRLFGHPERPAVCVSLRPQPEMCGGSAAEAMATLIRLEQLTAPR